MRSLPPEVLRIIEAGEGVWTDEAYQDATRLELEWEDVAHVAAAADWWKREKDEQGQAIDGYKDAVTGRDRWGRAMYLAGKRVYVEGEVRWRVSTFHEDKRS